jgi:hypothetical protein
VNERGGSNGSTHVRELGSQATDDEVVPAHGAAHGLVRMHPAAAALLSPSRLWTADEALGAEGVPRSPGAYAWYFRHAPSTVPTAGCVEVDGRRLLYVGIAPSRASSRQHLRRRLRTHFRGNAAGSTLRLTLGTLLREELALELVAAPASGRLTFGESEARLSAWMREHARVCWVVVERPWELETALVAEQVLPLNLAGNDGGRFRATLSALRAAARIGARRTAPSSAD